MKKKLLLMCSMVGVFSCIKGQWVVQNTNFLNPVHGISAITTPSANVAWAIGYDGSGSATLSNPDFSVTTDGGTTWTAKTITATGVSGSFVIGNISAIDGTTAFASLYDNNQTADQGIYKTTDGGTTWTRSSGAAYGASSWPDLVHFFNANDGVSFGDPVGGYYEIYTTSDGGNTWARIPNTGNVLNPVPATEYGLANSFGTFGNTICVGTNHGRIFRSTDKGLTWTVSSTPLTTAAAPATDIHKIEFRDANNAIAGSAFINGVSQPVFTYIKSADGGNTWTSVASSGAVFGADFCAVPGTTIYVSTGAAFNPSNQGSSMSTDDGATWKLIEDTTGFSTSITGQRTAVRFFNSTMGYAGGFTGSPSTAGGIFKWSGPLSPLTGIHELSAAKSALSAYPNPCRDNLAVSLSEITDKPIVVKIFNVLGEVVYQSTATYAVPVYNSHVDVSNFVKGIYIVSVNNGINFFVQKIIKD
jgi:photosystem II stability/assembly factor-like uncharacterized protein